ncbi:MAG TPA: hypothetical protein VF429_07605 [Anaerolineae bacterium]|jgi:hypothetical protein
MFKPPRQPPPSEQGWFSNLTSNQQLGYGCVAIVVLGALVMYCAGSISFLVRPILLQRGTPTEIILPTLQPTPTQGRPTFINLPPGTLLATPTQAPIPTREPPTITPTVDLTNPAPTTSSTPRGTPSPGAKISPTPTRKASATPTLHP